MGKYGIIILSRYANALPALTQRSFIEDCPVLFSSLLLPTTVQQASPVPGYAITGRKIACQLLLCCCLSGTATAYTPPAGIPTPKWGDMNPIELTAPSTPSAWPANEVAGFYYIDNTDPNCSTAVKYGCPAVPRCELPLSATFPAGTYLEVHGGPYENTIGSHRYEWTFQGTEDNPVWFRGASVASRPEIRGFIRMYGTYVVVENILFTVRPSDQYVQIDLGNYQEQTIDHAVLRHCEVAGNGMQTAGFSSAISLSGNADTGAKTHDIVLYDLKIHDIGDDDATEENDYHGILPAQHTYNIWILNCEIFNLGGDSVQVGSNNYVGDQMPHHVYIGDGDFYSNYENAVDVKNANHTVISTNRMHDFSPHAGYTYANPVTIHQQGGDTPAFVWVLFNELYNCSQAIRVQDAKDVHIIANTFYNIHASTTGDKSSCWYNTFGIAMRTSLTTGSIIDNTFYDVDVFVTFPALLGPEGVVVQDNLFGARSDPDCYDICVDSTARDQTRFSTNHFQEFDALRFGATIYHDLSLFMADSYCPDCQQGDPMLTAPPENCMPMAASPVVDRGARSQIYDLFASLYGISIERDHSGKTRPNGAGWDIGAYEFYEQVPETPPASGDESSHRFSPGFLLLLRTQSGS